MPAHSGIQVLFGETQRGAWIPAFAEMTEII
jgi:hypothetical protein